jgi:hypothetical protein
MSKFSDSKCWKKYVKNLQTATITYGKHNYTLTLKFFNTSYDNSPEVLTYYELETNDLDMQSTNHIFNKIDKNMISHDKTTNTLSIGEINSYNELTQSLINLIMTPDNVLQTKCGRFKSIHYRAQLVKMFSDLWS